MANLGFSIRAAFGLIPKTEKIESEKQALKAEYEKLNSFITSAELEEFVGLMATINSDDFKLNKKNILELNYKSTEDYKKELKFNSLKKDKKIINYFKVLKSNEFAEFNETEASDDLKNYLVLKELIESNDHKILVEDLNKNLLLEKDKYKEFKSLEKSKGIKTYFKIINSSQFGNYTALKDSPEIEHYIELQNFCTSSNLQEFKKAVNEQLIAEKNKPRELKKLKNSAVVKEYLKKNKTEEDVTIPDEIKEIEELESYLNSTEYQSKLQELEYKNTEEYKKEEKFKALQKENKFRSYFKFIGTAQYTHYNSFKDSEDLSRYEQLKEYIASPAHQEAINNYTYTNSDEYKKEVQFNELQKSKKIVNWLKYQKSKPYLLFKELENSEFLKEFETLEELISSDTFKENKEYLLDKNKWQKTNEYQLELRYAELEKSDDIKWYTAVKESNKFDELKAWKLTFEDDFTLGKVDEEKWMNSYFWGKMLLNDRYVMADDKHYFTDNKNVELNGTSIKLVTKKEHANGKVWHPKHGFYTKDFNYTSGMLSTAHSFRQLYGRIEAKIKINADFPVYQAFWLKGEKILPEIDVFRYNVDKKNRFQMVNVWGDPNDSTKMAPRTTEKLNGSNLSKDYFIYTLDWTENKLTWKINNIEVFSTTDNIPSEPLYMLLSTGLQKEPSEQFTQAAMEIDWVRCYEKV